MSQETEHFVCPCCGMHAPLERIYTEEPFELQVWVKTLGGKISLTDAEKEARKGEAFRRGSAHGGLDYKRTEVTDEVRNQVKARLEEAFERMGE